MTHFEPRPSQIKENRYEANKIEAPRPAPPYELLTISLFNLKPDDKVAIFFLSTREPVDPDFLQRCMDLVYPWRVDVYFASKTAFLVQFREAYTQRDIVKYTREAFKELV